MASANSEIPSRRTSKNTSGASVSAKFRNHFEENTADAASSPSLPEPDLELFPARLPKMPLARPPNPPAATVFALAQEISVGPPITNALAAAHPQATMRIQPPERAHHSRSSSLVLLLVKPM